MSHEDESELFFDMSDPFGENEAQLAKLRLKEGERREVAILFADVKGSTALGNKLDPEIFNRTLDPLMKRFSRCVTYYGGYVDKYLGDGIMALFGARRASEQDTERAVMAAIKMINQLDWINRKFASDSTGPAPELAIRIGINTGLVVVGKVGEEREGDFTVIGSAVNLAQRMEANAPVNSILMPKHAMQTVERFFEFKLHGSVTAKGFDQPVESYTVLGPRLERGQRWYRQKSVFIGREDEFRVLRNAVDRIETACRDALPQSLNPLVIGIMGDAGLGKTRLLHEFYLANSNRVNILSASTSGLVRAPLNLFTDLLEHEFKLIPGEELVSRKTKLERGIHALAMGENQETQAELEAALPLIGALLEIPCTDPRLKLNGTEMLSHLKLALRSVVQALLKARSAGCQPVMLVLDDIHWIDEASAEVMKFLLDRLVCDPASDLYGRVLVILLYRQDYHPLTALPEGAFKELALQPLSETEIARLLRQNTRGLELNDELLCKVQKLSMGNPFYLEEWCNYLEDIAQKDIQDLSIPPNLHALVLSRLDMLEASLRTLLQKAAVIGQQFFVDILNWIEAKLYNPLDVDETLAQLEQQAFVLKLLGFDYSAYFFKHVTTRDVAYQTLLLENRAILHKLAAEAIEELYPERRQEFLFKLADHYHRSGTADKAAIYLEQAARTATKLYNNRDAIVHWNKLLEWLPQLQEASHISEARVRLELTELKLLIGDWDGADTELRMALRVVIEHDDRFDCQRLRGILAFRQGDFETALEAWNASMKLADNPTQYAIAHGNLGIWYQHHKHWDEAFSQHEASLTAAEQAQDNLRTARTLSNLGFMYLQQKRFQDAEVRLHNCLELCETHQYLQLQSIALGNLGYLRYLQGNRDEAMRYFERKWRLVDKIDDKAELIKVLGNIANVHRDKDQHREALEFYRKVLDLKLRLGNPLELAITHSVIALELLAMENPDDALIHIDKALELSAGKPKQYCEYLHYKAEIKHSMLDPEHAIALNLQALEIAKEIGLEGLIKACENLSKKLPEDTV